MTALAEFAMLAHGWRRVVLLLVAGAVAGLSVAPLFILPALFVGFPFLVWSLDGAERGAGWRRLLPPSFAIGFWFGFGYFAVAIHWVGAAFFVDGGWGVLALPFAILILSALLAAFWGAATALAHLVWRTGPSRILLLALAMSLGEYARGHLFSGFPFDLVGYALTANETMMQVASLTGLYGLTFIALLMALTPALVWPAGERGLPARLAPFFAVLVAIAGQLAYGQFRLENPAPDPVPGLVMRLVQPSIPQSQKWDEANRQTILDRLLTTSEARTGPADKGLDGVTHIVWPESALPYFLGAVPETLARIARMLPDGALLVTGAPREDFVTEPVPGAPSPAYNAILVVNSAGEIVASYDKTHLVPFGEYLPFGELLADFGLRQFVPGLAGWTPGESRRLIAPNGGPALLPLICYEIVFPGQMGEAVGEAAILLNLTNDAWFDGSIGPAQHFHHARLRAVEEGVSLVRVANSGTTALVDPYGRLVAHLVPGEIGTLTVTPPSRLASTPYARWRDAPLFVLWGLGLVLFARLQRRKSA